MNSKTNVMRILEQKKINYKSYYYGDTDALSGIEVATVLNQNPKQTFKTLVTFSKGNTYSVFIIPVSEELDLKKASRSVNEKAVFMLALKDLQPVTGYIHGGCSPIGMKKVFKTVIDISANDFETIIFSAGKIGYQVEISLTDLKKVIRYDLFDLTTSVNGQVENQEKLH